VLTRVGNVAADELKLPTTKIGDVVSLAHDWLHRAEQVAAAVAPADPKSAHAPKPTAAEPPPVAAKPAAVPTPLATLQEKMRQFAAMNPRNRNPRGR
jgi:hypothetical protein